jgi:hypothetical protein
MSSAKKNVALRKAGTVIRKTDSSSSSITTPIKQSARLKEKKEAEEKKIERKSFAKKEKMSSGDRNRNRNRNHKGKKKNKKNNYEYDSDYSEDDDEKNKNNENVIDDVTDDEPTDVTDGEVTDGEVSDDDNDGGELPKPDTLDVTASTNDDNNDGDESTDDEATIIAKQLSMKGPRKQSCPVSYPITPSKVSKTMPDKSKRNKLKRKAVTFATNVAAEDDTSATNKKRSIETDDIDTSIGTLIATSAIEASINTDTNSIDHPDISTSALTNLISTLESLHSPLSSVSNVTAEGENKIIIQGNRAKLLTANLIIMPIE